jgi:hypothetical protein
VRLGKSTPFFPLYSSQKGERDVTAWFSLETFRTFLADTSSAISALMSVKAERNDPMPPSVMRPWVFSATDALRMLSTESRGA